MNDYKYKRPNGALHKVSICKWNKTFTNRGRWPFIVAEVYLEEDSATVQYVISGVGKATVILLAPILYVWYTMLEGFPRTNEGIKQVLFQKKYGAFSIDRVYKSANNESWDKLMEVISD